VNAATKEVRCETCDGAARSHRSETVSGRCARVHTGLITRLKWRL